MKLTLIPAQYLEQSIQYPELSLCRIVSQEKGLYRIISVGRSGKCHACL